MLTTVYSHMTTTAVRDLPFRSSDASLTPSARSVAAGGVLGSAATWVSPSRPTCLACCVWRLCPVHTHPHALSLCSPRKTPVLGPCVPGTHVSTRLSCGECLQARFHPWALRLCLQSAFLWSLCLNLIRTTPPRAIVAVAGLRSSIFVVLGFMLSITHFSLCFAFWIEFFMIPVYSATGWMVSIFFWHLRGPPRASLCVRASVRCS